MSTIIAVRLENGIVICSDGLAVELGSENIDYSNGHKKIYRVQNENLVLGSSGIRTHGNLICGFINRLLLKKSSLNSVVIECASYVKGLNKGFSSTKTAREITNGGFVPQTGVVLGGFIGNENTFTAILPSGGILHSKKYIVLGYSARIISDYLREFIMEAQKTIEAISLCRDAIIVGSQVGFSNDEFFCMSVSNDGFHCYEYGKEIV
jgi:20S proteasome alpha/beta subunit